MSRRDRTARTTSEPAEDAGLSFFEWERDLPPEDAFTEEMNGGGRGFRLFVMGAATGSALALLAAVLLVAVYALNVGTIWAAPSLASSTRPSVRPSVRPTGAIVPDPPSTPSATPLAPSTIIVQNRTDAAVSLVLAGGDGTEPPIGTVLAKQSSRIVIPGGATCLNSRLIAITTIVEIERSPAHMCPGFRWVIDGR